MGKNTVNLNLDNSKYLFKIDTENTNTTEALPLLFEEEQNAKGEVVKEDVLEIQEKINLLEKELLNLKDKQEKGTKNKAFTGGLVGLFGSMYMMGSSVNQITSVAEMPRLILKLEKLSRRIRKPAFTSLLVLGVTIPTIALAVGVSALASVVLGKENDKNLYKITEQKLADERAKLESLKQVC